MQMHQRSKKKTFTVIVPQTTLPTILVPGRVKCLTLLGTWGKLQTSDEKTFRMQPADERT